MKKEESVTALEIGRSTMSYFCYTIEYPDGTCLHLSDEGPHLENPNFADDLKKTGFHHEEDRQLGENVLHVYRRKSPATDIVPPDTELKRL
jgi:hypothetical protein